ncbi:MAG: hypothetical protein PSN37_01900 [Alphaproteobacteria bacterium]|nr:hypothetical protein [Alphaproteobacteria bacterium]
MTGRFRNLSFFSKEFLRKDHVKKRENARTTKKITIWCVKKISKNKRQKNTENAEKENQRKIKVKVSNSTNKRRLPAKNQITRSFRNIEKSNTE